MTCMKCGREISAGQVFCDGCLSIMEKYPVKPDTAIQLPTKKAQAPVKKATGRKRTLTPEELVIQLRRKNRRLMIWLIVVILLLALEGVGIFYLIQREPTKIPVGQNYTVDPKT